MKYGKGLFTALAPLLLMLLVLPHAAVAEVVLIVHPDTVTDGVHMRQVKELFLGKRSKWEDNRPVKAVTSSDKSLHKEFLSTYIQRSPRQWRTYWKRMIFTGRAVPPKRIKSDEKMIEYVRETPGAIGYVSEIPEDAGVKRLAPSP